MIGNQAGTPKSKLWQLISVLLAVVAFVVMAIALEDGVGLPFDTTYRIGCAAMCLAVIYKFGRENPGQRWPWISLWLALLVNVGLFFTPLVDRPASRGEIMLFALPSVIISLAAMITTYPVVSMHQRAMRQQMILGLVVAIAFCAALFSFALLETHTAP